MVDGTLDNGNQVRPGVDRVLEIKNKSSTCSKIISQSFDCSIAPRIVFLGEEVFVYDSTGEKEHDLIPEVNRAVRHEGRRRCRCCTPVAD